MVMLFLNFAETSKTSRIVVFSSHFVKMILEGNGECSRTYRLPKVCVECVMSLVTKLTSADVKVKTR